MKEITHKEILIFLHTLEKLKYELRHSWTSVGRRESVAEHSWRLALMVILCAPYLKKELDFSKAIQLAVLHDIGEAKIGDKHYLEVNATEQSKNERFKSEKESVKELANILGEHGNALFAIWEEFELKSTYEAQVVHSLDKLEACIQHNEASISTWTQKEKATIDEYFEGIEPPDAFISDLKKIVMDETLKKLKNK